MNWYEIIAREHHKGAGIVHHEQIIYVHEKSIFDALQRYWMMGNVSHGKCPHLVRPLSADESKTLESYVLNEMQLSIETAKKEGIRFSGQKPEALQKMPHLSLL